MGSGVVTDATAAARERMLGVVAFPNSRFASMRAKRVSPQDVGQAAYGEAGRNAGGRGDPPAEHGLIASLRKATLVKLTGCLG